MVAGSREVEAGAAGHALGYRGKCKVSMSDAFASPRPKNEIPGVGMSTQDPELLRRLLRAKDHIDGAPQEDWPVRRLARVSGVSEAHFARSFKDAFGVPPHRYLLTCRIERAKAMLRDTDLPVTEVALRTGWRSLGTFGRTFRDVTGEAPGDLRAREQSVPHALDRVPACFLHAAHRPDLTIAVSEKRRQEANVTPESTRKERS